MGAHSLILPIIVPALAGILSLTYPKKEGLVQNLIILLATSVNLWFAISVFGTQSTFTAAWGGGDLTFRLRLYHFSEFILLATSGFGLLIALYSTAFMKGTDSANQFFAYFLFTISLTNGAVLADDLVLLLFFWEALLLMLYAMIAIGHRNAYRTAIKAFIIAGTTDLIMMCGIIICIVLSGTSQISEIRLPLDALGSLAFLLIVIGSISKAGSMPFHSWIPDAAIDSPLPFMALVPAALEKLLGIYFLSRVTLDLFVLTPSSFMSSLLMTVGAITILLAVLMALIQKDFKKLLSFHAISQVGYMILGIGTAVPVGIVGGIFHMINHAMYKSCLFLTAGSIERQTGTTDLSKLGGLAKKMPLTCLGFLIAAASISGVPPFNGFFSKELVYEGALEHGIWFYSAALLGSVLTAASFLKLGHAAFFGNLSDKNSQTREAPISMTIPILVIASLCVIFGLWNSLPLKNLIQPIIAEQLRGHDFSGLPHSSFLVLMTIGALFVALVNHFWGFKKTGSGLHAVDHIQNAPLLNSIYFHAEKRVFDPYEVTLKIISKLARLTFLIDRAIDFLYDTLVPEVCRVISTSISRAHSGSHSRYISWSLLGLGIIIVFLLTGQ